jgi:hypothetical protein
MAKEKYALHFITRDKPDLKLPGFRAPLPGQRATRMAVLDGEVLPAADFHAEVVWFWPGDQAKSSSNRAHASIEKAHSHPFDEMVSFVGSDPADIHNLCGEIEIWIDGEKQVVDKSFMAYIPAGVVHGPVTIHRIDKPIFHYSAGAGKKYE